MKLSKDRFKLIPVVYLIVRRQDEVLLLRRAGTGFQDGNYSVIAGHLDGDELATAGIVREAKEEAGITVDPKDLRLVHTAHRLNRGEEEGERIDLFFETTKWQGEIVNAEPNKCDDLSWHPLDKLPDNMVSFVRSVVTDIAHDINYSEYVISLI